MKKTVSAQATPAQRPAPSQPTLLDRFEAMGAHGVWVVLGLALLMVAYVYWDYLTLAKVLLYTDIGSDSVNIFYPMYMQMAKLWDTYQSTSGFSLETVMGTPIGVNVWDPTSWLLMLGGPDSVPYAIGFVEAFKMLISTVAGFFFFRLQGLRNLTSAIGALCIGFSGYAALGASGWYVQSYEVTLLALALWATEYALGRKPLYYLVLPAVVAFVARNNSIFLVHVSAMLLVYQIVRLLEHSDWKQRLVPAGITLALMIGGLGLSWNQLAALKTTVTESGRAESIEKSGAKSTYGTNMNVGMTDMAESKERTNIILRSYSGAMMGSGNAYKGIMNFLEGPLLYFGLPMLLFAPFFLVVADKRRRIVFGVLLAALLVLAFFPWFRFAFWGFNLDYYREYTMLIGVALLVMSVRGLDRFAEGVSSASKWIPAATAIAAVMILQGVGASATDVDVAMRSTVTALLVGFAGVAVAAAVTKRPVVLAGMLVLTVIDLSLNADATINDRGVITTKQIEQGRLFGDDTRKAVDWIKQQDKGLYRIAKLDQSGPAMHQSLNDAMVMGFNGLIGYSSWHNKYYLRFMDEMGLADLANPSEGKWVFKVLFRPYLGSVLGAKYVIRKASYLGFDDVYFPPVHSIDSAYINQSKHALPLLVAYDQYTTLAQLRTMLPFKRELQLFKSVVVSQDVATKYNLAPYPQTIDTTTAIRSDEIAQWAQTRRAMMSVEGTTTQHGISATVNLQRNAMVVASIPYDPNLRVYVDGTQTPTTIANIGFVGFALGAGQHKVEVRYE
jgi:hypothetical protein